MAEPVLLYDGSCGLCARTVRFVLRHDRRRTLRFASLDGAFGREALATRPELQGLDTVVWYEPPQEGRRARVLTHSAAALRVLRYVGGAWRLGLVAVVVPRPIRDALYRLVARHRGLLGPPPADCLLPPPAERHRFLP